MGGGTYTDRLSSLELVFLSQNATEHVYRKSEFESMMSVFDVITGLLENGPESARLVAWDPSPAHTRTILALNRTNKIPSSLLTNPDVWLTVQQMQQYHVYFVEGKLCNVKALSEIFTKGVGGVSDFP